jgi:hypothetical protein
MTQSVDYRTCRSCGQVIQKRTALIHKFPQLFKLSEPQPDPYKWATADSAELTTCGTQEPSPAHDPAAPAECVRDDDNGQCVNYAAEYPGGPNLHACRDRTGARLAGDRVTGARPAPARRAH